jgi:hypothetical protein
MGDVPRVGVYVGWCFSVHQILLLPFLLSPVPRHGPQPLALSPVGHAVALQATAGPDPFVNPMLCPSRSSMSETVCPILT